MTGWACDITWLVLSLCNHDVCTDHDVCTVDTRRGGNAAPDEERWLFVGKDPCCPPSSKHRDYPGTLFDEVEKVVRRSYDV